MKEKSWARTRRRSGTGAYDYWQQTSNGDANVVGRPVTRTDNP